MLNRMYEIYSSISSRCHKSKVGLHSVHSLFVLVVVADFTSSPFASKLVFVNTLSL